MQIPRVYRLVSGKSGKSHPLARARAAAGFGRSNSPLVPHSSIYDHQRLAILDWLAIFDEYRFNDAVFVALDLVQ